MYYVVVEPVPPGVDPLVAPGARAARRASASGRAGPPGVASLRTIDLRAAVTLGTARQLAVPVAAGPVAAIHPMRRVIAARTTLFRSRGLGRWPGSAWASWRGRRPRIAALSLGVTEACARSGSNAATASAKAASRHRKAGVRLRGGQNKASRCDRRYGSGSRPDAGGRRISLTTERPGSVVTHGTTSLEPRRGLRDLDHPLALPNRGSRHVRATCSARTADTLRLLKDAAAVDHGSVHAPPHDCDRSSRSLGVDRLTMLERPYKGQPPYTHAGARSTLRAGAAEAVDVTTQMTPG